MNNNDRWPQMTHLWLCNELTGSRILNSVLPGFTTLEEISTSFAEKLPGPAHIYTCT